MSETLLNNFSLISRLFGNLFYRSPTDPVLAPVLGWLQQKGLSQVWALATDNQSEQALDNMQLAIDPLLLAKEYERLFVGEDAMVSTALSDYDIDVAAFAAFRQERGMPDVKSADHFGLLFLTASWIEDNINSLEAQNTLFEQFLLPCAGKFLTQLENKANLPFYRSLALLSRDILAAMADELDEDTQAKV